MKMNYLYLKMRYNTYDKFELETKPDVKEAGRLRMAIAWFFLSTGMAILFGRYGYKLSINGVSEVGHGKV